MPKLEDSCPIDQWSHWPVLWCRVPSCLLCYLIYLRGPIFFNTKGFAKLWCCLHPRVPRGGNIWSLPITSGFWATKPLKREDGRKSRQQQRRWGFLISLPCHSSFCSKGEKPEPWCRESEKPLKQEVAVRCIRAFWGSPKEASWITLLYTKLLGWYLGTLCAVNNSSCHPQFASGYNWRCWLWSLKS